VNPLFKQKLAGYGQWTYRGAWALEILASFLGLATAIALGIQAFNSADPQSVTSVDLILASAPFFMVSIAELTKIPIATLLFSVRWLWKPIVFLFLLALAAITFETVSMGLERAATLRQLRYQDTEKEINELRLEEAQLARQVTASESNEQLMKAQNDYEKLVNQRETQRKLLFSRITEAEKEFEGQRILPADVLTAKDVYENSIKERDRVSAERDNKIKDAMDQFEKQRDSFVERIKAAQLSGDHATVSRYDAEVTKLANPRPKIEKEYAPKIDVLDQAVSKNKETYNQLLANVPGLSEPQRKAIEARVEFAKTQLNNFDSDTTVALSAAQSRIDFAQKKQQEISAEIETKQSRIDELALKETSLEKDRIQFARTDQVRRLAGRIFQLKPEEVSEGQAEIVTVVWFGSLALLAALAGPVTAIVALSLQRIAASENSDNNRKLSRLLRKIILSWRWKRTKQVPVNVEIPVDRIVEKTIEVPVEKIIKEILYVPMLTDDPELVKSTLNEALPDNVRDLVKLSLKKA
jgi:hypothetical protein